MLEMYICSMMAIRNFSQRDINRIARGLGVSLQTVQAVEIHHANSFDEATAYFSGRVEQRWPVAKGWTGHGIVVEEVPENVRLFLDRV